MASHPTVFPVVSSEEAGGPVMVRADRLVNPQPLSEIAFATLNNNNDNIDVRGVLRRAIVHTLTWRYVANNWVSSMFAGS
jgi:hypothetical protein